MFSLLNPFWSFHEDDEHKNIKDNNPSCCEGCAPLSLPFVFYSIGSLCTKTGTQRNTAHPPPWKGIPGIEEINEAFEHHYDCYHPELTADEIERSSRLLSGTVSKEG